MFRFFSKVPLYGFSSTQYPNSASDTVEQPYESGLLKLNCDKALHHLHWEAVLPFRETVRMTAEWYRSYYKDPSTIQDVTFLQIKEYEAFAQNKGMKWIK